MNRARRGSFSTGARLLILATALTSVATSAQAAKLVVEDDRVECPQAGFTFIPNNSNTVTHFSDPVSHTPEANGIISGVFDPNHIVP